MEIKEKELILSSGEDDKQLKEKERIARIDISTALRDIADRVEKGEFKGIIATSEVNGVGELLGCNLIAKDYEVCAVTIAMNVTDSIGELKKDIKNLEEK